MRRKSIETRRFVVTVKEYEDSVDVVINLQDGKTPRTLKTSHKKGQDDWASTAGFLAGVIGIFEAD